MSQEKSHYKVAIVAPTCFYYQVALFRQLAADPRLDLTVYFCSDEALHARDVQEMYHVDEEWGDEGELLDGYSHKFLHNWSPKPSYLVWPYGLINCSIWKEIRDNRPDVVVLMSWMNVTWWIAIAACLRYKIPFFYLTDANVQAELVGPRWKKWVKSLFLRSFVFRLADGFLCAGTANRLLYKYYGVPDDKLVPFAYSWGYESFFQDGEDIEPHRAELRAQQGIEDDTAVILYCGRLSSEKNPLDLIEAYSCVNSRHKSLLIVGDGQLRQSMQEYAVNHGIDSINFIGFKNRKEISKYYAIADVLVLPSRRETWGIVVNEAMCFGLPVIASDQVGAARDLVRDGESGFIYPSGDVAALTSRLQQFVDLSPEKRREMGSGSRRLIESWINRDLTEFLDQYIDFVYSR